MRGWTWLLLQAIEALSMDDPSHKTQVAEPEVSLPPAPDGAPDKAESEEAELDAWKKVRELALRQLNRFMTLEPKVLRGDDPDAIHDMRVASRRLQQIMDLLYAKPRPRDIGNLRRKIRRSRRCLSTVRNCDVLIARVEKSLRSRHAPRRESWTAVHHYLRERRAQSFEKALRKLGKVNLAVFYVHLKRHLGPERNGASPAHHAASAAEPAPEQFYKRVAEALDRTWRAFESQVALSHTDSRPAVVHGARIATKRLRYLIEVVAEFGVAGSAESLAWLRELQQHLGDWHDLEVLEQMMIEMVARPEFLRANLALAMNVQKLIVRNRSVKKNFEEIYFRMTLESPDFQRLKDWAGYLLASPSAAFATA
jgi:CHAD domain-containing protein